MREIKSRGKRLDNGKWMCGSPILIEDTCFIIEPLDFSYNNDTDATVFWFDCTEHEVDPATVGQYTGQKDHDGKEIYEGDILKVTDVMGGTSICPVSFDETNSCFGVEWSFDDFDGLSLGCAIDVWKSEQIEYNVIGNIHDNPELLKTK